MWKVHQPTNVYRCDSCPHEHNCIGIDSRIRPWIDGAFHGTIICQISGVMSRYSTIMIHHIHGNHYVGKYITKVNIPSELASHTCTILVE